MEAGATAGERAHVPTHAVFGNHVSRVIAFRSEPQMRGPYAWRVVATVEHAHPVWDRAVGLSPSQPVSGWLPLAASHAIAAPIVASTSPEPATIGVGGGNNASVKPRQRHLAGSPGSRASRARRRGADVETGGVGPECRRAPARNPGGCGGSAVRCRSFEAHRRVGARPVRDGDARSRARTQQARRPGPRTACRRDDGAMRGPRSRESDDVMLGAGVGAMAEGQERPAEAHDSDFL